MNHKSSLVRSLHANPVALAALEPGDMFVPWVTKDVAASIIAGAGSDFRDAWSGPRFFTVISVDVKKKRSRSRSIKAVHLKCIENSSGCIKELQFNQRPRPLRGSIYAPYFFVVLNRCGEESV